MTIIKTALLAASLLVSTAAANAATFFGQLNSANDISPFVLTVTTPGTVEMRSFALPAFDPIFSLFDLSNGALLAVNDDFFGLESFISINLGAGQYQLNVTSYANFPNGGLGTGYTNGSFYPNGGPFSIDVTGAAVSVTGVPEPQSWALLVVGFGLVGATMRRRAAVAA